MTDNRLSDHATLTPPSDTHPKSFLSRVLIVAGVFALLVLAGAMFTAASDVFFLFFLAVLLAILLRGSSDVLAQRTGLNAGGSLALVILCVSAILGGGLYALGAVMVSQFNQLTAQLPHSIGQARAYLQQFEWGRQLLEHVPTFERMLSGNPGDKAAQFTAFFSSSFGALGNLLVLTFLTLYLAAGSKTYRAGVIRLIPPTQRPRGAEVLNAIGYHLWWWLVGRALAMVAVALITAVGLWLAGVPQYLVLALLSGLLTAVPFFGPIVAATPGILLALMQGPTTALWTTAVYILAQAVENYLLTPLIQQNTVELPPALAIIAVALAGVLFGVFGLIAACPLMVVIFVVVRMLYVEDVLGDQLNVQGTRPNTET